MTSDHDKRAAIGTARARLEAFQRREKGRSALIFRIGIVLLLIAVCLGALYFLEVSTDDEWFDVSRDAAWCVSSENWEGLEQLVARGFRLTAPVEMDRETLLAAIRRDADPTFAVFATRPHEWTPVNDGYDVSFWVIASRGNLAKASTVPLVRTWLVRARIERVDDRWAFTRASARPTLQQPR